MDDLLTQHLRCWLGAWPSTAAGVTVVGHEGREREGWDGRIHDVIGVASPTGAVLSVSRAIADRLRELVGSTDIEADFAALNISMPELVGRTGKVAAGVFRWSMTPTVSTDSGEWVATSDARVPPWLTPFNGDVLIAWDDAGQYGAGVGRKMHDSFGHELSVVTEEALRGRGIGRSLVETAARRVLAEGKVPTYLHRPENHASARLAEAAGFPDLGWRVLFFG